MTVTKTEKTSIIGSVLSVVEVVESGIARSYLGTDKGRLYKYNHSTGAVTDLGVFGGDINAMVYDASTYIYIGLSNGQIWRRTVSDGTTTVLYDVTSAAVMSMAIYSSTLWIGLNDGRHINLTVS